ncbi:SPOR domain-containing protein, partial [Acidomonas methanolica]
GEASSVRAAWAARGVTTPRPAVQLAAAHVPAESLAQDEEAAARPIPAAPTLAARPTLAQPASHRFSFHFITPAMAEPLPTIHHASEGKWAIQVGAYSSAAQAQSAVGQAHRSAGATLSNARALVAPVSRGRAHLYRARL